MLPSKTLPIAPPTKAFAVHHNDTSGRGKSSVLRYSRKGQRLAHPFLVRADAHDPPFLSVRRLHGLLGERKIRKSVIAIDWFKVARNYCMATSADMARICVLGGSVLRGARNAAPRPLTQHIDHSQLIDFPVRGATTAIECILARVNLQIRLARDEAFQVPLKSPAP